MIGPTGVGKTSAALDLVEVRGYVVLLATKPRDRTLQGMTRRWHTIRQWPPPNNLASRVVLWPKWRTSADNRTQGETFRNALDAIMISGGWAVLVDDTEHLTDDLNMGPMLRTMWNQARALDVSLIAASQRPRRVPIACWSNSSHFYIWSTPHPDDLKALRQIAGINSGEVARVLATLPTRHDLIYLNPDRRELEILNTRR